jgi:hypothetical protein
MEGEGRAEMALMEKPLFGTHPKEFPLRSFPSVLLSFYLGSA